MFQGKLGVDRCVGLPYYGLCSKRLVWLKRQHHTRRCDDISMTQRLVMRGGNGNVAVDSGFGKPANFNLGTSESQVLRQNGTLGTD